MVAYIHLHIIVWTKETQNKTSDVKSHGVCGDIICPLRVTGGGDGGLPAVPRVRTRVPDFQGNPQHAAERRRGVEGLKLSLIWNYGYLERREVGL